MSEMQQGPGGQGGSVVIQQSQLRNREDVAKSSVATQMQEVPINGQPTIPCTTDPLNGEILEVKRKCLEFGPDEVDQYGVSDVEEESFQFVWQLKNYSTLAEDGEILSPIFTGGPKSKHRWQLKITTKNKVQGQECFGISLRLVDFGDGVDLPDRKIKGRFRIIILDGDWSPGILTDQPKWITFKKTEEWRYRKAIPTAILSSPSRRLLENNSLRIQCQTWVMGNKQERVYSGGAAVRNLAEEKKAVKKNHALALDMGKALKNSVCTDIEIQAVDGVFEAHRAILAARSSVFAKLLNVRSLNTEITAILIHDFDGIIVQALLAYIYTGKVDEDTLKRRASDLLQAAKQYDLDGLKEDCEYALGENLTVENAADTLVLSDLHHANLLKEITMEFIDRHKEEIYKTPSFQLVAKTRRDLLGELYLSTLVSAEGSLMDTSTSSTT